MMMMTMMMMIMGLGYKMRGIFGSIRQQKFVNLRTNQNFGKTNS